MSVTIAGYVVYGSTVQPRKGTKLDNENGRPEVAFNSGITVTVKAGPGYDAPWIVIHATDADHADAMIQEAQRVRLTESVGNLHNEFAAIELLKRELGATEVKGNGRSYGSSGGSGGGNRSYGGGGGNGGGGGGAAAPSGPPPNHDLATECRHGEKNYVSGISQKTNKPWFGFDCPQNYKQGECARFAKAG
jgi:uncharacterized membrane protein YgcG